MLYCLRWEMRNKALSFPHIDFLQVVEPSSIINGVIIMITIQLPNFVERSIDSHKMNSVEGHSGVTRYGKNHNCPIAIRVP